ncbi:cyclic nucleotide-binding protein [Leptospira perolatii]|uniref:Cyclic nucleotide-binding protein n=1 Tax=Leptospira perolatii TaxID=2023191 RepID=A0A2M9ZKU4_9LEPT|nr:patatin-like phospholipase family protein [Leptospira perolatii]PJZ68145.1 cyclic nucleotide-binding protein [Leptospira perolatii]PJZ72563.1 cyclic nucleotide-binding protein [Leptospira perolatii]
MSRKSGLKNGIEAGLPHWFSIVFRSNEDLFREWNEEEVRTFVSGFEVQRIPSGRVLVRTDRPSAKMFFLLEGICEEFVSKSKSETSFLTEIGPGSHFGEAGFFGWPEGGLGIRTKVQVRVASVSKLSWKRLSEKIPEALETFCSRLKSHRYFRMAAVRPDPKELFNFLSSLEILFHFDRKRVIELQNYMQWLYVPGGERLIHQGDPGNSLFIIVSGRFRFVIEDEKGERISEGEFGKGDIIGEMSLLTGEPRSASVYAVRSGQVIRISRDGFRKFISRSPDALFRITETIARRLTEKTRGGGETGRKVHTIALVPVTRNFPLKDFSNKLSNALKAFGSSLIATKEKFEKYHSYKASKKKEVLFDIPDILSWLNGLEREYDKVIFEVDHEDTLWVETCLRQADRILFLIEPGNPIEDTSHAWKVLRGSSLSETVRESIFYLENEFSNWSILEEYYKEFQGQRHFVRKNRSGEFERVARRMEGKAVGIALSGGGAKGFAHLGFLRSIQEQGIPVDLIGGTSAGSIMAGLFAMGFDFEEMLRLIREIWIRGKLTRDYSIPFISILTGGKYSRAIREFFGERKIETLWIPFLAVACNLTKSEPVVFEKGEIWKAIRASTSIPGIFPPFYDNGSLYVDGGLWDNLPGSALRTKGADILISVDLGAGAQPGKDIAYGSMVSSRFPGEGPSAIQLLMNGFLPMERRSQYPHIGEILMRSLLLSSRNNLKRTKESSDIFVEIPAREFSTFDWDDYLRLYELGYETSQKNVKEWARKIRDKIYGSGK